MKTKALLSIVERRNSHTLRTPNGNFTMGYSGERATDLLASDAKAFKAMREFVNAESNKSNFGIAFAKLADEKILSKLWPNWNQAKKVFSKGTAVKIIGGNTKYGVGVVEGEMKGDMIVDFGGKRIRISSTILEEAL